MISPLFMTTVMPRAMPMISATPSRSRAPSTNESVSCPSLIRPMRPIRIANSRNDAVISGNHHHRVGSPMPMSSHGMTPYIMTQERQPEHPEDRPCAGRYDGLGVLGALDAEAGVVLRLHVVHDRPRGVAS